jgi:hypothetical protein
MQIILSVIGIISEKLVEGNKLINSMERIISCGPNILSPSQEILHLPRNQNFHCSVHKCPPMVILKVKMKSMRKQTASTLRSYMSDVSYYDNICGMTDSG